VAAQLPLHKHLAQHSPSNRAERIHKQNKYARQGIEIVINSLARQNKQIEMLNKPRGLSHTHKVFASTSDR
jgi:hypothetical protein